MSEIFGVPTQALFGQLLIGLINGSFYALLSLGLAVIFGLTRASKLLKDVETSIHGRLLVFFPGHHDGSNYRLLDARDGWNYLAIAITAAGRA